MAQLELLDGAIRVDPYLLVLDLILLAHFAGSYYLLCYRRGLRVDFWHFTIFLGYVLPFLIIYPFSASFRNVTATGASIVLIQRTVDAAYVITVVGYVATYAGLYLHDLEGPNGTGRAVVDRLSRPFVKLTFNAVNNTASLLSLSLIGAVLVTLFLGAAFSRFGLQFNLRDPSLADPVMRPLFNLVLQSYVPLVSLFVLVRYLQYREGLVLVLFALLMAGSLFSGVRSVILQPILSAVTIAVIAQGRHASLWRYGAWGAALLVVAVMLGSLRDGHSLWQAVLQLGHNLIYGNNFSDVRDFAWILAYWDGEFIWGRSYLAALMSFVPRALSEFRGAWSIGLYTNSLVGFDSLVHPGLRPGKFGEPYFNFGVAGVVLIGIASGYLLRRIDVRQKAVVRRGQGEYIRLYSFTVPYVVVSHLQITASFWQLYVLVGLLLVAYGVRQLLRPPVRHAAAADVRPLEEVDLDGFGSDGARRQGPGRMECGVSDQRPSDGPARPGRLPDNGEIDFRSLWRSIVRRRRVILATTLGLTLGAAVLAFLIPPVFESRAALRIGQLAYVRDIGQGARSSLEGWLGPIERPQELIERLKQEHRVGERNPEPPLPRVEAVEAADPRSPVASGIVEIRVHGRTPEESQAYLRRTLDVVLEQHRRVFREVMAIASEERGRLRVTADAMAESTREFATRLGREPRIADALAALLLAEKTRQLSELRAIRSQIAEWDLLLSSANSYETQVVLEPTRPESPVKPRRTLIILLGAISGLGAGVILALVGTGERGRSRDAAV